ncbi:MAG TPA: hypothetical protein VLG37_01275 [Candidatus Saccharimonadales bacterium]|nr:hypothetical protein [Candidatus Saccharimonadales bacterium]
MAGSQTLLEVPGKSVTVLRALADQAGLTREAYTDQSIRLGLYLAHLFSELHIGADMYVWFEAPDKNYDVYKLDFVDCEPPRPIPVEELPDLDPQPEPLILEVDPSLMRAAERVADLLGANRQTFIESSLFFRWRWLVTRQQGGEILVDDGANGGNFLVVEEDIFLRQ